MRKKIDEEFKKRNIVKYVSFYRKDDPDTLVTKEVIFKRGTNFISKKIFDYLYNNQNLFMIENIKTKYYYKKVIYTLLDKNNNETYHQDKFHIEDYPSNKDILNYFYNKYNDNFLIDSIENKFEYL